MISGFAVRRSFPRALRVFVFVVALLAMGAGSPTATFQEQDLCDWINSQPGWEAVNCRQIDPLVLPAGIMQLEQVRPAQDKRV